MPLKTVTNLSGSGIVDIMVTNDQGEEPKRLLGGPVQLTFAIDGNATGVEFEIKSTDFVVVDRGAVQGGGTLGTPPSMQDFGQTVFVPRGILQVNCRDTTGGGTTDLNFMYDITPLG